MNCQQWILGITRHDSVRNSEVSLRTGLAPVSDRITRGRNAIFGHVARLPDNTPAHQAMLRQSSYRSVDPHTLHGNVHQVDHVTNGPTNSAAITTMFPLRLCGGKPLVAVTREPRYGPRRRRRPSHSQRQIRGRVERDASPAGIKQISLLVKKNRGSLAYVICLLVIWASV